MPAPQNKTMVMEQSFIRQLIDAYVVANADSCGNADPGTFAAGARIVAVAAREIHALTGLPMEEVLACAEVAIEDAFPSKKEPT